MADRTLEESRTVLELSPSERDDRDITLEAIQTSLRDVISHGSREDKILEGCSFPCLSFAYNDLVGANEHPLVFRDCTFEGINVGHADVTLPLHFQGCTVGELTLEGARFEHDIILDDTTVTGAVNAFEARFDRDADFADTTFTASVSMDEVNFAEDASFADATFERAASFRAAAFHGTSNALGDNADFAGVAFENGVDFHQATFEFATFENAVVADRAGFEEVRFDGDAIFADATFDGEADFDEVDFGEDTSFEAATFHEPAVFRGAAFEGGARALQDDASFANTVFHESANFRAALFRQATFEDVIIRGRAMFEEVRFDADVEFIGGAFEDETDFDEARFHGDTDFTGAQFERPAVFRGAAFEGEARHLEENATFEGVRFRDDADFDEASFTSANFRGAQFGGVVDFTGAEFRENVEFAVVSTDEDAYVDFTDAVLREGTITQPVGEWTRYDFTRASIGDVAIEAERDDDHHKLLDYFRFCATEFNEFDGYEFDFSAHTYYLDRNDWKLHTFDEPAGVEEYALTMTPANVETTYLKAKNAASDAGYVKAAGEFRVHRQRYARRTYVDIARDSSADLRTRITNLSRAVENYFLHVSCGYGMRLGRIMVVFLLAPLLPTLLYTFGGRPFLTDAGQLSSLGQLATPTGQAIFYKNLHFSYITFLTIGYGGIGPKGALARLLAGLEVYLSVILGGLVLYALIKRSEL